LPLTETFTPPRDEQLSGGKSSVGLAVGLAAGLLFICAAIALILVCRRRQRRESSSGSNDQKPLDWTAEPDVTLDESTVAPTAELTTYAGVVTLGLPDGHSDGVAGADEFL
jgi:hypothetical protein